MEIALFDSQETLLIAEHLKNFKNMKKRHEKVIKYAETFEKLSEDENVALVHIENLCMRGIDL